MKFLNVYSTCALIPDTGLLSTASAQPLPQVFKTLSKFPTPLQFLLTDFSTPFQVSHIFSAPSSNLSATACLCSGSKAALLKKKCQIFSMPDYRTSAHNRIVYPVASHPRHRALFELKSVLSFYVQF